MAKKAEDIYREALTLSQDERAELIRLLIRQTDSDFVSPDIEQAWIEEAERRHRAVLDGTEQLVLSEQVMRELREIVSK